MSVEKASEKASEGVGVPGSIDRRPQTLLAFDFGTRFIGIAVGDTETRIAHPLEMIAAEDNATRFARIQFLIDEWHPTRLVLGLPLTLDGAQNDMTRRSRRFAKQLEGRFSLPVEMVDERLSSASAQELLGKLGRGGREGKHNSHALAAQIILQGFLDERAAA
ncbi:MAG: Holliday junction resolvase RuvX [Betaproteobacteria bacterium]|nr:Holliday junction resolvase RuvX [Betaproteobacteria bacterium]